MGNINKRKRQNSSWVWDHFEEEEEDRICCKVKLNDGEECGTSFIKDNCSTTKMAMHLLNFHNVTKPKKVKTEREIQLDVGLAKKTQELAKEQKERKEVELKESKKKQKSTGVKDLRTRKELIEALAKKTQECEKKTQELAKERGDNFMQTCVSLLNQSSSHFTLDDVHNLAKIFPVIMDSKLSEKETNLYKNVRQYACSKSYRRNFQNFQTDGKKESEFQIVVARFLEENFSKEYATMLKPQSDKFKRRDVMKLPILEANLQKWLWDELKTKPNRFCNPDLVVEMDEYTILFELKLLNSKMDSALHEVVSNGVWKCIECKKPCALIAMTPNKLSLALLHVVENYDNGAACQSFYNDSSFWKTHHIRHRTVFTELPLNDQVFIQIMKNLGTLLFDNKPTVLDSILRQERKLIIERSLAHDGNLYVSCNELFIKARKENRNQIEWDISEQLKQFCLEKQKNHKAFFSLPISWKTISKDWSYLTYERRLLKFFQYQTSRESLSNLLDSLELIHEAGFVYNDVKLGNVLYSSEFERAILSDVEFCSPLGSLSVPINSPYWSSFNFPFSCPMDDIYAIISLVMDASYLKVSTAPLEQIINGSFHSELIRMENTQLFEWIHENSPELSSETVHVLIDVLKRKRIFSNVDETRIALRL